MSTASIWNHLKNSARSLRMSRKAKPRRLVRQRRTAVEQLECRRLFVADLVNFLTTEHVDINLQRSGTEWSLGPRDSDDPDSPVQYANDEALLYAGSPSVLARPSGPEFDFIGVNSGQNFYMLPASQNPELLYLGFAAYGLDNSVDRYNPAIESKGRATGNARYAKASLTDVRHTNPDGTTGNGHFSLWQSGTFGGSVVFISSYDDGIANPNGNGLDVTDGISADDAMWIVAGGHSHFNFGFTQPGRYEVDLKLSAYFGDDGLATPNTAGFSQSDDITIYFSVMSVGQMQFDASSYSVNEEAGTASIDVVRVGGSDGRIAVDYATSNGTATTGSDYTSSSGTLEFLDGETRKTITIPILEDTLVEGDETFNVLLSSPTPTNLNQYIRDVEGDANGLIGTIGSAVVTIIDNDIPPSISDVADQTTPEDIPTGAIAFTVGDDTTPAGSLVVTATSSNTTLVPNGNIVLGGSGANRTVTITPALNLFGSTTITLTVTDEIGLTATDTFILNVTSVNDLPTISDVGNQSIDENTSTGALAFTVGDVETAAAALVVTASSSNTTLVPNGNIVIGGSGANRTVTVTPAANQSGSATITLTVTDADGGSSNDTFIVNVNSVNSAPTISDVGNQTTDEDTATGAIAFTVGDAETSAGSLVVTATSSNTTLVPNGNIVLGGSGANRTATITPALDQFGSTTITLTVTDAGGLTATDTFVLNVTSVNDLPTISDIGNQSTQTGIAVGPIGFTIGDVETAAASLTVSAASTNTTLLPLSGIVIAGSGASRTVTLTPAAGQTGSTTVTLTVTDADGGSRNDSFDLVVTTNNAPTISDIADRFVIEGNSTGAIAFTVGDTETPAGDLVVTATSSNQTLIPNASIVLGGSGADRTISLSPIGGQLGSTTITVSVTDAGGLQSTDTFLLTAVANRTVPFALPTYHGGAFATQAWGNVSGDFSGDGNIDMVLAGTGDNALTYMQGNGDGTFQPEQLLNAGTNVSSQGMVAIDYDGDGDKDVLVYELTQATIDGTADEGTITLYRNNGAAQFTRVVVKSGLAEGYRIEAGDFNGDGKADVVYGTTTAIAMAIQQPDGQLGVSTTLSNSSTTVVIGDVNDDGKLDVVTAGTVIISTSPLVRQHKLEVFLGNGDGTFGTPLFITPGNFPEIQGIVDLNGDGRKDLLVWHRPSGAAHIAYYPQQTDGSFAAPVGLLPTSFSSGLFTEVADVNKDGIPDIVSHSLFSGAYRLSWVPGLGGGAYGTPILVTQTAAGNAGLHVVDLDNDSHLDFITVGAVSTTRPTPVAVLLNKTGENPMVLIPPAARTRVGGDSIDLQVYFGFPITVTGTPRIALDLGGNTVYANYVSGSGTPTLTFRYIVAATDVDLDGVQLSSNLIDLNGGTLTNPIGGAGVLEFPNTPFNGVVVNARGPLVQMVSRLDTTPTEANAVRFSVQFAEDVTGVDVADFSVRMTEGDLAGAVVTGVTGSGSLYEVTVSTGSGSGTLGLSVSDSASIFDLSGDVLAKGYSGGQVYTVRQLPIGNIDYYYTDGHADYRTKFNDGEFAYDWTGDSEVFRSDEVITYLDSTAIVTRPAAATYDFTGVDAGAPLYLSNSSGSIASVPFLGFSGDSLVPDVFANYRPSDPRITSSTLQEYVKVEMVGMRSSSDGDFSVYSIVSSNPRIWMASSDGIDSTDNIWLYRTHFHRNIAFSKPGTYEIDIVMSGYLDGNANNALDASDTYVESGIFTMVFHVDTLGARNDAFELTGQETLRGSVTLNDQWDDGIGAYTASVQTTTTKGALSLQPNGSFTYQPSATFDGSDSFTYRLTNPRGGSTTATVTITGSTRPDFDAVLRAGHTDIGVNFEDDAWDLHIHDEENDIEYEPDEAMLYVGRDAMLKRSGDAADSAYDFLGVPAGDSLFVLPQTENPNLLFLGVGAEELADGVLAGNTATLRLASVSGPGQFSIWQSGLTPTTPQLIMATSDGIDAADAYEVEAGSHAHMNFAFTKKGFYEVTFVAMGVDADGNATDGGQVTYYFSVSDGLVPFAMPNFLDPNITSATAPQLSDLNGDRKLDLAITRGASGVGYVLGIGDGSFLPVQLLAGSTGARNDLVAIDFDGDGDVDLLNSQANATDTADILSLYLNDGTANFTRVELIPSLPRSSSQIEAADLNGDGRPDVVYGKGNTVVAYALQQPDGTLGSEVILPVTLTTASVQVTDLDADGDQDIVVGNRTGANNGAITVFKSSGSGVFTAAQTISTGNFPSVLKLTDMDGDGRVDIVTTQLIANTRVGWYPQMPNGTFGARVNVMTSVQQLNSLEVGDFNVDGVPDIVAGVTQLLNGTLSFVSVWSAGLGSGAFANPILLDPNQGNNSGMRVADLDGDSYPDIIATGNADSTRPSAVRVLINKTGEDPMVLLAPAAGNYVVGDSLLADVYFGFPIVVTGTPRIALQMGANTVFADYLSGSGTGTLRFRYIVSATDVDLDGLQLASNLIELNGGTLKDPLGGDAVLTFPNLTFNGVFVNGAGPLVQHVTRLDSRATDAAMVRFQVQFAEAVTNVDATDFDLVMNAGDLAGAMVTSVTGSGSLYEVTVYSGTGSGTLGLSVTNSASINDLAGDILGKGFVGGEVYTVRKPEIGEIDAYYTNAHADYRPIFNNGEFSFVLRPDAGLLPNATYPSEHVTTYLDSTAIVTRPAGANYDFLGAPANSPIYLSNSAGSVASVPFLGFSGESILPNTFASYVPADSRVTSTTPQQYMKVEMVGMRSDTGGQFSLYSIASGNPRVWMASSDGISSTDNIWLRWGSHTHFNTAFSKPGTYEVDVVISGFRDSNGNGTYEPTTDQYVESGIKTIVFTVDALGAVNDTISVYGRNTLHGSVTLNDEWHDGMGAYSVSLQSGPTNGALSLQSNGAYSYVPSATFSGTDSFVYRLTNERGGFTTATVTITGAALPDFEVTLTEGHADIGAALGAHDEEGGDGDGGHEDPEWDLHVHDGETDTEYHLDEALLYIGMDAQTTQTADAAFAFTGANPGDSLFVLPPVESPTLLFLGFGTEEIDDGTLLGGSLNLKLKSVSGPGHFSVWNSTGTGPEVAMATFDGITEADMLTLLENSHAHYNLGFTKMGLYQVTFQAIGTLADGDVIESDDVTYFFQVGNTVEALDVQNGQTQRSFVRNIDLVFGQEDSLEDLLAAGRVQITKSDLNGNNAVALAASAYTASVDGDRLRLDFGVQGIGGNRNTNAGDGYYRVAIDIDGDGEADVFKHFYRLLGDMNGDRKVDLADRTWVMSGLGTNDPERDVNGDGVVNALDNSFLTRAIGRKLKDGLWVDD